MSNLSGRTRVTATALSAAMSLSFMFMFQLGIFDRMHTEQAHIEQLAYAEWKREMIEAAVTDPLFVKTIEREAEWLALNLFHEVRDEPSEGILAVMHVVFNRLHSEHYPPSIRQVVRQKRVIRYENGETLTVCQFSWYCDGRPDTPEWEERETYAKLLDLARRAIAADKFGFLQDFTGGALFYYVKGTEMTPRTKKFFASLTCDQQYGTQIYCTHPRLTPMLVASR